MVPYKNENDDQALRISWGVRRVHLVLLRDIHTEFHVR